MKTMKQLLLEVEHGKLVPALQYTPVMHDALRYAVKARPSPEAQAAFDTLTKFLRMHPQGADGAQLVDWTQGYGNGDADIKTISRGINSLVSLPMDTVSKQTREVIQKLEKFCQQYMSKNFPKKLPPENPKPKVRAWMPKSNLTGLDPKAKL